jgi:hypothetical protein
MHHSLIRFISQNSQSFSGYLSHTSLEHPPQCRSLNHLLDATDTIGCRPLVNHHTYTPKVRVPMKQPQGSNEERGLARTQRLEHGPQSPREVADILTIAMGLHGHIIPTWRRTNVLPCYQLYPCHLDKRRWTRVNNHKS